MFSLIYSDQLFHVLALHMRLYTIDSEYNPWKKLTQLVEDTNSQLGNEEQKPEVPILYHDVTSLLLIQILMMPQPLRKVIILITLLSSKE
uniref:E3 ubiquitin-protein ligase UBR3-like n=1 Tax=Castor canadensis TaxID=51338 RepID=A0A8B7TXQ2_CASCN|nr:E3 ubiquitin-protein ligase UBR3-like [Castor canadensis]